MEKLKKNNLHKYQKYIDEIVNLIYNIIVPRKWVQKIKERGN